MKRSVDHNSVNKNKWLNKSTENDYTVTRILSDLDD